jgi:hypothetical protein
LPDLVRTCPEAERLGDSDVDLRLDPAHPLGFAWRRSIAPRREALVGVVEQSPHVEFGGAQLGRSQQAREPELSEEMLGDADRPPGLAAKSIRASQPDGERLDRNHRVVDLLGVRIEVPAAEERERCR